MDTLYDLLGALPRDDAEDLRAAFRRAVKGAHPDLRPGDPDAALKFRQIVRANDILIDSDQRAAYDHLLVLARREQQSASVHPVVAWIHGLASAVIALAGASIVAVGGYLLFIHISTALIAPANNVDVAMRVSPDIAAISTADAHPADQSTFVKRESKGIRAEVIAPSGTMPITKVVSVPPLNVGAAPDPAPNDARFFRARGISAYRYGDLNGAIADLDQAIQLDPNFSASYIDRSIVLYRLGQFDRAFADIARAKRIEKESRAKSMPTMARKPRLDQSGIAHSVTPQS
ncbi:DnaJ domain-containing protein [Bradyrhizobium sp.]|uniref:DnaJ domain-containing protein n=1 Tax=Bradyrhizobium sp. TaxID=376 RepID=UPI003C765B10